MYWTKRNKSDNYSKKLNILFQESLKQVVIFSDSSIKANNSNTRLKVASHFEIIYSVSQTKIFVLDIWDKRQNPQNFPI